ncbi:hypothetical protein G7048_19220 [Diaphorobacter sp. HDW4B]|uniref:hypothetical protein n=1 Tax=Diaphorobacter sp. HDW4B TaxID=2714925 RepID=UPI00140DBBE1|nr:hypothetical protein [Diaphorobacter sp. HDW4B]QIL72297.1 hypothetical protein G7048_19220 [Diaphorobacter sp. HDW4B]
MKLYTSLSQLNQPPHYGSVGKQHVITPPVAAEIAKRAHAEAQFARIQQTARHGGRAVVRS